MVVNAGEDAVAEAGPEGAVAGLGDGIDGLVGEAAAVVTVVAAMVAVAMVVVVDTAAAAGTGEVCGGRLLMELAW